MSHPRRGSFPVWSCAAAIWFAVGSIAQAAPTVWSGLTLEFTRPSFVTPPPADQITPGVAITRDLTQGIYNPVVEAGYNGAGPTGTEWATDFNNAGKSIAAANFADLAFATWLDAYGGFNIGNVIVNRDAVVHLINEDIYLDLRFTQWINGHEGGGGFTYLRAEPPAMPTTTGDYNNNGVVDAADYVLWRRTLDQTVATPGDGADGDQSGTIDAGDYTFWRARFGNVVGGPGAGAGTIAAVPEPAAAAPLLIGMTGFQWCSGRRRRFERHFP